VNARSQMRMRCTIERSADVSDTGGGWTQGWTTVASGVPCHWWAVAGQEIVVGDQVVRGATDRMIVPLNTDVSARDRVATVTDRNGNQIVAGPVLIDAVLRRRDHLALQLSSRSL
jgi:head-tail adaptor